MAKNYNQGIFVPKHPEKYIGRDVDNIHWRSAWELTMMRLCDEHPNVKHWASESIAIPYFNPILKRWTEYVPDFLVIYEDRKGKPHGALYEIKPSKQALLSEAKSDRDRAHVAVNMMKWKAAREFCKKRGLHFEVITEDKLYWNTKSGMKKPKRRPHRRR